MEKNNCINLDTTLEWLQINSDKKSLNEWSKFNEHEATVGLHDSVGRGLRNELGLWTRDDKQPDIAKYFNSIGIYHADDMSGIILTSLHRILNKKDIKLDEQVTHYRKYWEDVDPKINEGKF